MTIIGILGRKGSGKDTAANYIVDKFNFTKIAFADPLKNICAQLFDFDYEQLYGDKKEIFDDFWKVTPRSVFQFIGTDLFRNQMHSIIPNINSTFWIKVLEKKYLDNIARDPNFKLVISDVRFQDEIDMIKKFNGYIIKLERNFSIHTFPHISEDGIDNISSYDYSIDNNYSIIKLHQNIDNFFLNYQL